jgi:hypothetical protein
VTRPAEKNNYFTEPRVKEMLFRFKSPTKRGRGDEMHKKNTKKGDSLSLLLVSEELKDVMSQNAVGGHSCFTYFQPDIFKGIKGNNF